MKGITALVDDKRPALAKGNLRIGGMPGEWCCWQKRLTEKEKESKRNKTKENLEFTVPTERGAAVGIGKPE